MRYNKHKIFIILLLLFGYSSFLVCQTTFFNSYPYQDLWPEFWYYTYHDGTTNVIPALDGGFLMVSFVNPGYEFIEEPQSMFFKISEDGELEWRMQDYSTFGTYIRSIVSNGVDRYYAIAGEGGTYIFPGKLFILDENCNVISIHDYWQEDSLYIKINSMQLLDDGLIMAGSKNGGATIIKTNLEGEIFWETDYLDIHPNDPQVPEINSVITTYDSGFLTCSFQSSNPGTGYLMKFDAQGDTLWTVVQDDYQFLALVENTSDEYLVFCSHFSNGATSLISIDLEGNILDEHFILTDIIGQSLTSRLLKINDGNILIFYNAVEGEIHKVTPNGEVIWSRNYLDNGDVGYLDWIGKNDKKGFQLPNGDIVFCGTTDRQLLYPEHVLLRVDAEGNLPVSEHTIVPQLGYTLYNYPNPFNPETTIQFNAEDAERSPAFDGNTELLIYNIKGQKVKTFDVTLSGVEGSVIWYGTDNSGNPVACGIYYYQLKINGESKADKKMLLIK